jgi:hypothetical protein
MLFRLIVFVLMASTIVVGVVLYVKAAALEKEIAAESSVDEDENHEEIGSAAEHEEELD